MDNYYIHSIVEQCPVLKFKFGGVWSADDFPKLKKNSTFIIVNASGKKEPGTHWLLLVCTFYDTVLFWDSLGNPIETYMEIYLRCNALYKNINQLVLPLQGPKSNMCGAYCIYMAHQMFKPSVSMNGFTNYEVVEFVNEHRSNDLMQFGVI